MWARVLGLGPSEACIQVPLPVSYAFEHCCRTVTAPRRQQGANGAAALALPALPGAPPVVLSWHEDGEDEEGGEGALADPGGEALEKKVRRLAFYGAGVNCSFPRSAIAFVWCIVLAPWYPLLPQIADNVTSVLWRHGHLLEEAWAEAEGMERDAPIGQLDAATWASTLERVVSPPPWVRVWARVRVSSHTSAQANTQPPARCILASVLGSLLGVPPQHQSPPPPPCAHRPRHAFALTLWVKPWAQPWTKSCGLRWASGRPSGSHFSPSSAASWLLAGPTPQQP